LRAFKRIQGSDVEEHEPTLVHLIPAVEMRRRTRTAVECRVGSLCIARVILEEERYVVCARSEDDVRLAHLSLGVRRGPDHLESMANTVGTGLSLLKDWSE